MNKDVSAYFNLLSMESAPTCKFCRIYDSLLNTENYFSFRNERNFCRIVPATPIPWIAGLQLCAFEGKAPMLHF